MMPSSDELLEQLRKEQGSFYRCFTSADGRLVMHVLERLFDGDNIKQDADSDTAFALGKRDVVRFIKRVVAAAEGEKIEGLCDE